MPGEEALRIYLIAGEASGDMLGEGVMQALHRLTEGRAMFYGVGGERMQAAGLHESLFPYQELSLLGFAEVLPHALKISARIGGVAEDIRVKKPDVVLSIDVPGFSYRVARKLKREGWTTPWVHYVAPSVWAYKPGRAAKCAKVFDHLLALLPFEPPYFTAEGLDCTFVGHPVACRNMSGDGAAFRVRHGIPEHAPLLALLPGSRRSELRRHIAPFAAALLMLAGQMPAPPGLIVPIPDFLRHEAAQEFEGFPLPVFLVAPEEKNDAFAACELALVKSGTVALEVAMAGLPMVVSYRTHPISAAIFRRMALTRYVNLLNVAMEREIIPELLQERCAPAYLAEALSALYHSPERRETQRSEAREALARLRPENGLSPDENAARTLLQVIGWEEVNKS